MILMGSPFAFAETAWSKSTLPTSMLLRCRPAMTALSSLSVWTFAPAAFSPNWSATSFGSSADAYATLIPFVDGSDDDEVDDEFDDAESLDPLLPQAASPTAIAINTSETLSLFISLTL